MNNTEDQITEKAMTKAQAARDKIVAILQEDDLSYLEGLTALGMVMSETFASLPRDRGMALFNSLARTILDGAYPDERDTLQ